MTNPNNEQLSQNLTDVQQQCLNLFKPLAMELDRELQAIQAQLSTTDELSDTQLKNKLVHDEKTTQLYLRQKRLKANLTTIMSSYYSIAKKVLAATATHSASTKPIDNKSLQKLIKNYQKYEKICNSPSNLPSWMLNIAVALGVTTINLDSIISAIKVDLTKPQSARDTYSKHFTTADIITAFEKQSRTEKIHAQDSNNDTPVQQDLALVRLLPEARQKKLHQAAKCCTDLQKIPADYRAYASGFIKYYELTSIHRLQLHKILEKTNKIISDYNAEVNAASMLKRTPTLPLPSTDGCSTPPLTAADVQERQITPPLPGTDAQKDSSTPPLPSATLATTEQPLKCTGSQRIHQPVITRAVQTSNILAKLTEQDHVRKTTTPAADPGTRATSSTRISKRGTEKTAQVEQQSTTQGTRKSKRLEEQQWAEFVRNRKRRRRTEAAPLETNATHNSTREIRRPLVRTPS